MVLNSIYYLYLTWQHQTPEIKETELMDGLFNLQSISVDNRYKKAEQLNIGCYLKYK